METLTFNELRKDPEKLDPFLKDGKTVRVTREGKPYFDAVPAEVVIANPQPSDFDKKVEALWMGTGVNYSTDQIVDLLRESRG